MGTIERREREKRSMREQILRAAMKLFLEEGFEKVTIRRIAEDIEYSPATIYLYFKDKDEILYALHEKGFEELYERQQHVLSIKDPLLRLKKHGQVYVSFALQMPEYYDLMFIMRAPTRKIRESAEWSAGKRSYEFLKENIRQCMKAGYLAKDDPDVVAFSVWAHVHGMASLIIRERCTMFPVEKLNAIVEKALDYSTENMAMKKR
ncbi:MAG: TetR/AcrR family transcriptional regulator [Dissulfurispiraceae bacterium]